MTSPHPRGGGITPRDDATFADRVYAWRTGLIASPRFQSLVARIPIVRRIARGDAERLFNLTAGFLYSQVLQAFVRFDLSAQLATRPRTAADLAMYLSLPTDRMVVFCQAATAIGLLARYRDGRYGLGRIGAALSGVPGLAGMIQHHDVLYRDMRDPVEFFRDGSATELAAFWPYVFGANGPIDPKTAAIYSTLMADSQVLIAQEILPHLRLHGVKTLLDIGGGTGVFLSHVGARYAYVNLHLFDLPAVVQTASNRFAQAGLTPRAQITGGDFRTDVLPKDADMISLVRILYDHQDDTVRHLLAKVYAALPPNGRLIVAEPLAGGAAPTRAGDAYFGLYCMAMGTGRARSAAEITTHLTNAGFSNIRHHKTRRPFITGLIEARKRSHQ